MKIGERAMNALGWYRWWETAVLCNPFYPEDGGISLVYYWPGTSGHLRHTHGRFVWKRIFVVGPKS